MILFRCWYCHRRFTVEEAQAGTKLSCNCGRTVRVPRRSGGSSLYKSASDRLIEFTVYGIGGGLIGFCLGGFLMQKLLIFSGALYFIAASTLFGFVVGGFGGERGVAWIGSRMRDREEP
jgi:hypothetical protein